MPDLAKASDKPLKSNNKLAQKSAMKKRVIFLDQNLNAGGAERVLCTIIRTLNPEEFEIHLLLIDKLGELAFLVPKYVSVHELNIENTRKALWAYIKRIRQIKPEIIFTTTNRTTILSIIGKLFLKYRIIARYPTMPRKEFARKSLRGWRLVIQKYLYRLADIVIAQTEEMADELKVVLRVEHKKIVVIPNPIDTFNIHASLENENNPFDSNKINIVASGRIVPLKGYDVLIQSMVELIKIYPKVMLYILGKDVVGHQSSLEDLVDKVGLKKNIYFLGFKSNPYPFYKFCDVYVLSSHYEGMPNALLECLYLGRPVVATRCVPIIERLIENGRNGYLVNVNDAKGISNAIISALELKSISLAFVESNINNRMIELLKNV